MAKWNYTIDFSDFYHSETMTVEDKGKQIAARLEAMFAKSLNGLDEDNFDPELEEIIYQFQNITGYDDVSPVEEFDEIMEGLYNWADQEVGSHEGWPFHRMLLIKTQ